MNIGEPRKIETNVPRPERMVPIKIPMKPLREPVKVGAPERKGMSGRLLLYECPKCGRELEELVLADSTVLSCPVHGPVQELVYGGLS